MADNWKLTGGGAGHVPGAGDTAVFDSTSTKNVTSSLLAVTVAQLTITSAYTGTINLKSLTVGQTGGTSTVAGGTIIFAANGFVNLNAGTFNWSAGSISSLFNQPPGGLVYQPAFQVGDATHSVTVNITGSANFAGNFDLSNYGNITISTSNNITLGIGSHVDNNTGAVIDVQSNVGFVGASAGFGKFENKGTFKKTAGTGTTSVQPFFINSGGTFEVRTGVVSLTDTSGDQKQTAGTTTIYAGAKLQLVSGTYVVSAGIIQGNGSGISTVVGNLTLSGGDFYVGTDGTIGTFNVTNNYTQSGGTLHIDVDGSQAQVSDLLTVGNNANLGGNLTVNTLGGTPTNDFTILTYLSHENDFASITYLGGVEYTPLPGTRAYKLRPPPA